MLIFVLIFFYHKQCYNCKAYKLYCIFLIMKYPQVQEFIFHIEFIIPILIQYLSHSSEKDIKISLSPFIAQPLVLSNHGEADCIEVKNFLKILADKWEKELSYMEEIIHLKDNIYNLYTGLWKNEGFFNNNEIENLASDIVDKLFEFTKVEKKQVAGNFCNDLVNGFEVEALDNILYVCNYALWEPLLTPFPFGVLQHANNLYKKIKNKSSMSEVKQINTKIIEYLRDCLEPKKIFDCKFHTDQELRNHLKKLSLERKVCTIHVSNFEKFVTVINEYKSKCIEHIEIECWKINILKADKMCFCNSIKITDKITRDNLCGIMHKIPRVLKKLNIACDDFQEENVQIFANFCLELFFLQELKINFSDGLNKITDSAVEAIASIFKNTKHLKLLKFRCVKNQITDQGLSTFACSLKNIQKIISLTLDFSSGNNQITSNGLSYFCSYLKTLTNLAVLKLSFRWNEIEDRGAEALAIALKELKLLKHLGLNFGNHYYCGGKNRVTKIGIKLLFEAIDGLTNLEILKLNFKYNPIIDQDEKLIENLKMKKPSLKITHPWNCI